MATLGERVDVLEQDAQELRHRIDAGLRANALGISLVHEDTQAIKQDVAALRAKFHTLDSKVDTLDNKVDALSTEVTGLGGRMQVIEESLTEVLRRLPEPSA